MVGGQMKREDEVLLIACPENGDVCECVCVCNCSRRLALTAMLTSSRVVFVVWCWLIEVLLFNVRLYCFSVKPLTSWHFLFCFLTPAVWGLVRVGVWVNPELWLLVKNLWDSERRSSLLEVGVWWAHCCMSTLCSIYGCSVVSADGALQAAWGHLPPPPSEPTKSFLTLGTESTYLT